jgi:hypothetical protein
MASLCGVANKVVKIDKKNKKDNDYKIIMLD